MVRVLHVTKLCQEHAPRRRGASAVPTVTALPEPAPRDTRRHPKFSAAVSMIDAVVRFGGNKVVNKETM
jgi:hypothetical protein